MRLVDKVAIVTGSAGGIGKATALRFAVEGAKVAVLDIDLDRARKAQQEIVQNGGDAICVEADVSKEGAVKRAVSETVGKYGRIDILVNNAAKFVLKGLEATVEDWQESLGTNVIGAHLMTKYSVREMKKTGGGAIVMLGSISSFIAQPEFVTYSATKAMLVQMARNYALDLAPFGIRVNSVCPGHTMTPAVERIARESGRQLSEIQSQLAQDPMLKRMADPSEIASAILFLVSADSSYVTGTHLMVDGGYVAL